MTVQSVLDTLGNLAGRSIDTLDQARFLTPAQSEALLVAAVLLVAPAGAKAKAAKRKKAAVRPDSSNRASPTR